MRTEQLKIATLKAAIILIPCWFVAWLTDKMVYVLPLLAATAIFASTLDAETNRRIDDDDAEGEDDAQSAKPELEETGGS